MHGGDIYRNKVNYDFSININPLGPPAEVAAILYEAAVHANKYPDLEYRELLKETANIHCVEEDTIVYGNGASEIIMAIVHSIQPKSALLIAPSFTGYEVALKKAARDCKISYYHLLEENNFDLHHDILERILVEKPELMFLTNPNNPTGRLIDSELLEDILTACDEVGTTIVVDECFLPLTVSSDMYKKITIANHINSHNSLILLKAFTKSFAIPGARIGYAICSKPEIAEEIKNHLPEWNLSIFAQMAGAECLKQMDYLEKSASFIKTERKYLSEGLSNLGLKVFGAEANFILFKSECLDLKERLLEYGILIRDCSDYEGLEKGFYRVAVRAHNENGGLLIALGDILSEE